MSVGALLVGGSLAVGVSAMAKSALKYTVGASKVGQRILQSSFQKYGWGTGFIPVIGVMKAMINIPRAASEYFGARGAFAKTLGAIKKAPTGSEWYSAELSSGVTKPLYKMLKQNIRWGANQKRKKVLDATMDAVRGYSDILGGSSAVPTNVVPDLLKTAINKQGLSIKSGVNLESATSNAIGTATKFLNQAHASKRLIGPTLTSNMAVVGLPALSSGVMTSALTNAMRRRSRNKLRGYE